MRHFSKERRKDALCTYVSSVSKFWQKFTFAQAVWVSSKISAHLLGSSQDIIQPTLKLPVVILDRALKFQLLEHSCCDRVGLHLSVGMAKLRER